ncbi:MAG: DUF1858 domain-containing protein [Christensenellales bacterium]|jgi:selenophosphate synthetase-related protein
MTGRIIDLDKSVHALCTQYPELAGMLADAGFSDITKPGMLATAGRLMTIPKGAALKKIALSDIVRLFRARGYEVTGGGLP